MRRTLLVAVLAAVALAGCGGDDDAAQSSASGTATATATGTPEGTATPSATPDAGQDKAIAEQALLTLDDFPSGWEQEDDEGDPETSDCEGIKGPRADTVVREASPNFSQGQNTAATSSIWTFSDDSTAEQAFAKLTSQDTRECIGKDFGDTVEDGLGNPGASGNATATLEDVSTSQFKIDPVGDERSAARITLDLAASGDEASVYVDVVYVRVGRGVAFMLFTDILTPFDEELAAELTSKTSRRLAVALDSSS